MTMTEMLEATIARRAELQAEEPKYEITHCGKTFEIEGVGKIWCGIQIANLEGASTWMRPHFRRNWKLNGKRIAAAKLAKIIGA
jgi:hypothetical protein